MRTTAHKIETRFEDDTLRTEILVRTDLHWPTDAPKEEALICLMRALAGAVQYLPEEGTLTVYRHGPVCDVIISQVVDGELAESTWRGLPVGEES